MLSQIQLQSSTHVRYIFMLITQRDAELRPTDCRSSLEERDILLSSLSLELCAQIHSSVHNFHTYLYHVTPQLVTLLHHDPHECNTTVSPECHYRQTKTVVNTQTPSNGYLGH